MSQFISSAFSTLGRTKRLVISVDGDWMVLNNLEPPAGF